ncbi:hypothetical protein [Absidia glauca]|uniref:FAR1 domain-containing protein n=1 Tax=Absidia glauca TaxID=4829 RepID=A0A168KNX0_ABSGL|nr:hypothetical protein [Absidia glauca]
MSNPSEALVAEPVQQDLSGSEQQVKRRKAYLLQTEPDTLNERLNQLEPFYTTLLSLKFTDSATAIKQCRALCAQYGFTVKQEASTHRNIYVYCSREGLPDSQRNPKSNPQRKRPSKRCDCRWRVVLYERDGNWEFRKSLNPEAAKHNHDLMRPEEIETSWPKEVNELICELARQRLPTQEIRSRVKAQFTSITWNERRFYNRLSDARQKIRYRESGQRAQHLTGIWTKICMVSVGHEDLADYVEDDLIKLLETVCKLTDTDESSLTIPTPLSDTTLLVDDPANKMTHNGLPTPTATTTQPDQTTLRPNTTNLFTGFVDQSPGTSNSQQQRNVSATAATSTSTALLASSSKGKAPDSSSDKAMTGNSKSEPPKGYINIDIPQHSFMVKIHTRTGSISHASIPQLSVSNADTIDSMMRNPRRTRSTSSDVMDATIRKQPRKARSRQSLTSPTTTASSSSSSLSSPSSASVPMGLHNVLGTPLHRLQQQQQQQHHDHTTGLMHHHHHQQHHQQQQNRPSHPLSTMGDESIMHPPPDTGGSFMYPPFDTQGGLPLDATTLSPYAPFQNTYSISTSSSGFTSDMSFQFDPPPSPTPMGPNSGEAGRSDSDNVSHSNEPTIHPALQSNPMAHHERHQPHQQLHQHHPPHLRKIQPLHQHHHHQQQQQQHHHHHHHPQIPSTAPSGMTIDSSSSPSRQLYSMTMRQSDGSVKLGQQPSPTTGGPFSPSYSPTTPTSATPTALGHTTNDSQDQHHHLQSHGLPPRRVSSSSHDN